MKFIDKLLNALSSTQRQQSNHIYHTKPILISSQTQTDPEDTISTPQTDEITSVNSSFEGM
jgi:hypothetical protein